MPITSFLFQNEDVGGWCQQIKLKYSNSVMLITGTREITFSNQGRVEPGLGLGLKEQKFGYESKHQVQSSVLENEYKTIQLLSQVKLKWARKNCNGQ